MPLLPVYWHNEVALSLWAGGVNMGRTIDERRALRMLDIPDFRHMTKEKAVQLVSMLDRVDPAVAKAVLEQYPEFASILLESARDWKESVGTALEENGKITRETAAAINAAISSLSGLLEREDVGEAERDSAAERMVELARLLNEVDKRNKDFILKVLGIGGAVLLGFAAVAASVLGVSVKLPSARDVRGLADTAKGVGDSL